MGPGEYRCFNCRELLSYRPDAILCRECKSREWEIKRANELACIRSMMFVPYAPPPDLFICNSNLRTKTDA